VTDPSAPDSATSAATVMINRPLPVCWRAFVDAASLTAWVPGLRRVRVVARDTEGLPVDVQFEFAASLTYTLGYQYDLEAHEVRWEPRAGRRDGVSGRARFVAVEGGTELTYQLTQGAGRSPSERALGEPEALARAFADWVSR
jgi:hypothetical protein